MPLGFPSIKDATRSESVHFLCQIVLQRPPAKGPGEGAFLAGGMAKERLVTEGYSGSGSDPVFPSRQLLRCV
jgi:hypothetical protein